MNVIVYGGRLVLGGKPLVNNLFLTQKVTNPSFCKILTSVLQILFTQNSFNVQLIELIGKYSPDGKESQSQRSPGRRAGHPTPPTLSPSRQTAQKWRELDGNCCAASRYIQDGGNRRRRRYNERLLFPPNYQQLRQLFVPPLIIFIEN